MGNTTKIEWTDATWNPIIGCSRVSEGCRNCYAEGIAGRFGQGEKTVYSGLTQIVNGRPVWTGKIAETRKLLEPLSWKKPKRVFVNSMSDLFHENVTDEQRDRIFGVMALCPHHTFQVLTKRPAEMLRYFGETEVEGRVREAMIGAQAGTLHQERTGFPVLEWSGLPMPNVLLGVSVENQAAADERLEYLCHLAAIGWPTMVSFEPLLGPVVPTPFWLYLGPRTWAIVGGESGPHARPMSAVWARYLRDRCTAAGIPFFFKQWGEWVPIEPTPELRARATMPGQTFDVFAWPDNTVDGWRTGELSARVGKKAAGAMLDGREWHEFPEVAHAVAEL